MSMSKAEFKERWDGDDEGGGITHEDIARCAVDWGLYSSPKIHPLDEVTDRVVAEAGCTTGLGDTVAPE